MRDGARERPPLHPARSSPFIPSRRCPPGGIPPQPPPPKRLPPSRRNGPSRPVPARTAAAPAGSVLGRPRSRPHPRVPGAPPPPPFAATRRSRALSHGRALGAARAAALSSSSASAPSWRAPAPVSGPSGPRRAPRPPRAPAQVGRRRAAGTGPSRPDGTAAFDGGPGAAGPGLSGWSRGRARPRPVPRTPRSVLSCSQSLVPGGTEVHRRHRQQAVR